MPVKKRPAASVEMICSVSELANLFHRGQDIGSFLNQVVNTVVAHMETDVCSIYMFNQEEDILVLRATAGLNPEMVGRLTLATGEGLTGLALKELRPIREGRGRDNPYFKRIPGSGEERFESFLAVPIIRGIRRVGVMVLQDEAASRYTKSDALALRAIASQLAATLENAQLLIELPGRGRSAGPRRRAGRLIRGKPVVDGAAVGRAYPIKGQKSGANFIETRNEQPVAGIEGFREAVSRSETQLEQLQAKLEEEFSDVASLIFSAHLLMLRDSGFSGAMERLIEEGSSPGDAVRQVADSYIALFGASDNPRMREKILDIKDLSHRIMKNLAEDNAEAGDYSGQIVLTDEMLPSELLKLSAQNVEGIVLFGGSVTAHVSVLARSLQVPLISTEDEGIFRIPSNSNLALDAFGGLLIVNPDETALTRILGLKKGADNIEELKKTVQSETHTADGERIRLRATINLLSDIKLARYLKAEGIGLYRSEFPFLIRSDFPSEEEQYRIYRRVVEGLENPLVTLRTLDVGGDKILSYLPDNDEANPFLGLRAIRFLLENKKVFVGQLKAMLRAGGKTRKIRILFPLISSLDDFLDAKKMVHKSLGFLERDGLGEYPMPDLGAMIELPSAVSMAPELAREADFLSLGTNDLIQYLLGVDRTNEKVADLFDTAHPAVLRAVKKVADAAHEAGCPLSICGIMSREPRSVYYMMGLGVREFSLEPSRIPGMQQAVSRMRIKQAREDAAVLSGMGRSAHIRKYLARMGIDDSLPRD